MSNPFPPLDLIHFVTVVIASLQLVQKPCSSLDPDSAAQLGDSQSPAGLPADAPAAADPMAEAHGLTDPRNSDMAVAMEGVVEGDESHGRDGTGSAAAASAAQKVGKP